MANLQLSPDLRDALAHGSLAVFWGGDLPQALTGLPSRQDLAQRLAASIEYKGRDQSLEAVAQAQVSRQSGYSRELNQFIIQELGEQNRQPQLIHRLAARLPVSEYIVTAYDGLLEDAMHGVRPYNYPIVVNASLGNLDFLDPNLPTLIWLYGRVREQQSLVVTRDAHLRLVHDPANAGLLNHVRDVMRIKTLLFIGYDLSDVDFELLYTSVLTAAGPLARRAFAVQPGLDPDQRLTWQQRNVELIDADPLAVLSSLLNLPLSPSPLTDPRSPVSDLRSPDSNPSSPISDLEPAKEPPPMPTLPDSVTLNQLLQTLTADDIDQILLLPDFSPVRDSAGPSLNSLRFKLRERAEKQLKVPLLLEQIYRLNRDGYLQIMGAPPAGHSSSSTTSPGSGSALGGAAPPPGVQLPDPTPAPAARRIITYYNFEVRIRGGGAAGQYSVETTSDLGGQADATVAFDPADVDFTRLLNRFGVLRGFSEEAPTDPTTVRTPGPVRSSLPPAEKDLAQLGFRLQQLAFPTAVYNRLLTAQSKLGENDSLRIRLRLDPPELAVLPWELLTDSAPGPGVAPDFWGLNQKMSLVRFPAVARTAAPVVSPTPLRILLAVAGPTDQRALKTADEIARVRAALAPLGSQIELVEMDHVMAVDLLPRLRETFHILHFIGHGTFDQASSTGQLVLEDENHTSDYLNAKTLGQLLSGSTIRLVFLNACDTAHTANSTDAYGIADVLVKAGVPAVVAMQTAVRDDYAILFAQQFYRSVAQGLLLDDCVGEGRRRVLLKTGAGQFDWAIPVLTTRVSDGRLFKP
jgi:hypothetical protein